MKHTPAWAVLILSASLSGCGGAHQLVVPSEAPVTQQSSRAIPDAAATSHWKIFRLPSTGQAENVYSWPQRDGSIVAYGKTCCYPGGAPPDGEIDGITTSGTAASVSNANPPRGAFPVESVPMFLFPCAQSTQICSTSRYYVYGPNSAGYYFRNQSAPDAVQGSGNDVWFTVCCNNTYIVHGSNGSLHYFRTPNSLTDKAQAIARTADGNIWVTLQHAGSTSWILARLNPATSVVTQYPLVLPSSPAQLLVGADGNIWFAIRSTLYRVEASSARVTRFALPQPSTGYLAKGPNATLWTPYVNTISDQGLMETSISGAVLGAFTCPLSVCARDALHDTIQQLTQGPDGNIWFAYSNTILTDPSPPDDLYEGMGVYIP